MATSNTVTFTATGLKERRKQKMFQKNDVVEINYHGNPNLAMSGSPCLNLQGTIAKIKDVKFNGYYSKARYTLEFIDIHAKDYTRYEKNQEDLYWKDEHLIPFKEEQYDFDTMSLFVN